MSGELSLNFESTIRQIDDFIRSGQREKAHQLLESIKISSIPRAHLNALANLARRCGQFSLAWQIISPVIRPKYPLDVPATNEEKATYAIILLGLGAQPEAIELLESCDQNCPDVLLAFAFASINRWDYTTAITKLRAYLRCENVTPYQQMIAKVNLAASYVAVGDAKNGLPLLVVIQSETEKNGWSLLQKNSLEISAQMAIQEKNWEEAEKLLSHAIQDGEKKFYLDNFFVKKWQAVISLLKRGPDAEALREIESVRSMAETNKHWETIRDCDYYKAVTLKDEKLALHLYFGTPYASYRKRLVERCKDWLTVPAKYEWNNSAGESKRIFDIQQGEEINSPDISIKPGTALHRLIVTLSSDFYRPFSVGSIHSMVYAGEHFNPHSSPKKVAFLIQRLRAWLKENDIPLSVNSEKDGYQLHADGPYALLLEKAAAKAKPQKEENVAYLALLKKLRQQAKNRTLPASEIASISNLSIRSVRYFLKWAIENKKIQKVGSGRESKYQIR